ncbi:fibronectin type III domain-containing protein, partial [Ruminococcus bicirculans (ex Wegman et al. 2014)]|uniref:fibronectin type III domain-containing protein n=2 Tax=Ruminococcus TaxID=1263 RepID=UPI00242EC47A
YIDDESFYGCTALESVTFGNGVEEIGDYAFENCTSLSKVYIPVSVKKIGAEAFGYTFGSELTLNKNFSMTCAKDSAAEKYAKENGITYDTYQVKIDELAVSGIKDKEYTGKPVTQNIVIKNGNVVLDEGTDYTVTYSANTKVGTVEVTITGTGSYIGEIKSSFDILPAKQQIQKLETRFKGFFIDWAQKGSATGYEIEYSTNADFKDSTVKKLTANKPDTLTISGLTAGNKYYVRVRSYTTVGEKVYYGAWSDSKNITTAKYDITKSAISGISTKTYTGKNITQSVKVKYNGKTLKSGIDYTVSYSSNKNVGTATVKITGKGQYGGTVSKTFKINPAKQKIQKLTAKSKAFFIDWAQKGSATGYEVQYTTNSKFTGAKKLDVANNKTDKMTISKLSANKKYYVKVRSYTLVKGTKYYGEWSAVKSVTTKK